MHVESNACKRFDSTRGAGDHVPQHWPCLQAMCAEGTPSQWLLDPRLREALQQRCGLCGRRMQNTTGIAKHLYHDHADIMQAATAWIQRAYDLCPADGPQCYCPVARSTKSGHKCPVLLQAGVFGHLFQPQQRPQVPAALQQLVNAANYASCSAGPCKGGARRHSWPSRVLIASIWPECRRFLSF